MTRALLGTALALAITASAWGQAAPTPLRPADPLLDATPVLIEIPPAPVEDSFRISLDFGFPTGVRLQARLFESRFWAEVGTGVWWIVPYVSTALRYDCHLFEGSENLFAVRPSVSATLVPLGDGAIGFGADIEFIWQHRFTDRFVTDLGLRFGATAFHDEGGHWAAVPVLAIVFAVQF